MAAPPLTRKTVAALGAAVAVAVAVILVLWPTEARRERTGPGGPRVAQAQGAGPRAPLRFDGGRWQRSRRLGPIALAPPADGLVRVTGTVVDAGSGGPVPDVEVVFADGQSEATTQSDLAGRYSIDVPPAHYRPFVRAPGIVSVGAAPRERLPGRPRADQVAASRLELAPRLAVFSDLSGTDLEVVRAGVIAGRVFDRAGQPIAGALVRAATLDGRDLRPVLGTDVAETDLDGTFRLEVGEATYVLEAFHDRHGATESPPTVTVTAGDVVGADLTMIAGCLIRGQVVRAGGGPAGDGSIERAWSQYGDQGFYPAGSFDDDGSFEWSTTEEGEITLRAWPWKSTHSPARTFACKDGARFDGVVFVVPDTRSDLGGTILTAGGAPAGRAFIDIMGMSEGTMNQQERADDEGRWEVFALPPGTYQVTAYVDGQGVASAVVTAPGHGSTLRLSGTGSLVGRVTGIDDGTFRVDLGTCSTADATVAPRTSHLVTVRGGAYRLDGVPACELRGEAASRVRKRPFEVTVSAGGVTALDLDLSPPRLKTVTGVVRDPAGRPVPDAHILVLGSGDGVATTSDASGRFTVTAHAGDLVLFGHHTGNRELPIADDDPDRREVDITLEPGDW